jgi:hypothetical protein
VVDAQSLAGEDNTANLLVGEKRNIDVEQDLVRQTVLDHLPNDLSRRAGRGAVVNFSEMSIHSFKRDRDTRHACDHGLHCSRNGSRVGDIMPKIGSCVDAGNHEINRLFEEAKRGERHAIGGRAITGECLRAIRKAEFPDAQRAVQGFDVPASGPVSVWCQHRDFSQLAHFLDQSQQARRQYTVIVCYQNMFFHAYLPLFKSLRRFCSVSTANTAIRPRIMIERVIVSMMLISRECDQK